MRKIKIKCPYCGHENTVEHKGEYGDLHIVVCDCMEGGCDKAFVADVKVNITAEPRKIEGEGQEAEE